MNKNSCFEYIVFQILNWYSEVCPQDSNFTSFTRLKILKLLFFISAIRSENNDEDLLDIFDKFYAMQHGPVESDIYNAMVHDELSYYSFKSHIINFKSKPTVDSFDVLPVELKNRLDNAVIRLRQKNNYIISYTAFKLVDLSHKWECWRVAMRLAQVFAKGSEVMDKDLIRNNNQYYSL